MTRRVRRFTAYGLFALSLLTLQSCSDRGRGPTTASPVEHYTPRSLAWECVQGSGGAQTGGWSFGTPAVDCGPANAPVPDAGIGMVSAAPGNLRSTITGTTVRLDWNPLIEAVTSFVIEAGSAATLANLARLNTGNPTPALTVTSVPSGVYFVRVRAIGPDGIPGPASNEIVVAVGGGPTCATVPAAPTGLTAQIDTNQVTLSWTASAGACASSYVVEAGSAPALSNIVVFNTGSPAAQLTATAPSGTYYVRLRGQNAFGIGPPSNEIIVFTPGGIPQGVCEPFLVSPTSVSVSSSGGVFEIRVNTNAGCQWSATSGAAFISPISTNAGNGPGIAQFSASVNSGPGSRQGAVRFSRGSAVLDVSVSQPPPGVVSCNYSVNPTSAPLFAAGGPFEITVTTAVGCPWSVTPGTATFASLLSSGSASGPGVARFSIQANGTASERRGTARVTWVGGGQDVALLQTFTPAPPPVIPPPVESAITVPPQPEVAMAMVVPTLPPSPLPNAGACTDCRPTTGNTTVSSGAAPGTVNFRVDSGNGAAFNALILALSGLAPATAPGFAYAPDGSSSHYVVTFASLRTSADVTLNVVSGQAVSAQVAVAVNSQLPTNYVTRTITPSAPPPPPPCAFSVNGPTAQLSSGAGTFDVSVTSSPSGCSWTASSQSPSFISVVIGSGSTPGTARFSVTANSGSASRSGTVTVAGQNVSVTQAAPAANRTPRLTSPGCTFPSNAGPGSSISCPGSAVDDDSGDLITWAPSASHTCSWFVVSSHVPSNPLSVNMSGTVPANFFGTCAINFTVCDQRSACIPYTGSYTWNRAPRITSPGCTFSGGSGTQLSCTRTAVDDPGDLITFSLGSGHTCTWYTLASHAPANPLSVLASGTVPFNPPSGSCTIVINACDQRGACTSETGGYSWSTGMNDLETIATSPAGGAGGASNDRRIRQ